jgi:DNA-binding SARP family transcriptional activator/GAF domain-containing protein
MRWQHAGHTAASLTDQQAATGTGSSPSRRAAASVPALDHTRRGNPVIVLDTAGRILATNAAARRLFGVVSEQVLGRPCHAVLNCCDLEGRRLCPLSLELLARHRNGQTLVISATAVPADAGTSIAIQLRPSVCGLIHAPPGVGARQADRPSAIGEQGFGPLVDLHDTLDRLLLVTGADAAELFLTVPSTGQSVLVAHRGAAPRAFRQIVCFNRGQGFPGLVSLSGAPLLCLDLANDARYLRSEVKRHGFRFYLCVPVRGASGALLGSLHIAARRRADAVVPHVSFLAHAAWHLGAALEFSRLDAAVAVSAYPQDLGVDAATNLQRTADWALQRLIALAGVDCGALLLHDQSSGELQVVSVWNTPSKLDHTLPRACKAAWCPALTEGRWILPDDTARRALPLCATMQHRLAALLCLPLVVAGQPLGVALLGCRHREKLPTSHLSFLHAAVHHVAVTLHNAQIALRQEHEAYRRAAYSALGPDVRTIPTLGVARSLEPVSPARAAGVPFLDVRCLGRFTLIKDGHAVPPERFVRRRSLTLLKILLTRYGKPVHREELMEILWPDGDPQATRVLLNVAVHYLRRALEPDLPAGSPSHFVRTCGECYAFDTTAPHRLDSQQFLAAAGLGDRLEREGRLAEALDACRDAISLYAGDFLEDEPYSDWCAVEREYLREVFLTVLRRSARLFVGRGDVDAAVACYRRALLIDATLEDMHRGLMELLWRTGRRDEALRQYQVCRAILQRELGVAPLPETEALRERIAASR